MLNRLAADETFSKCRLGARGGGELLVRIPQTAAQHFEERMGQIHVALHKLLESGMIEREKRGSLVRAFRNPSQKQAKALWLQKCKIPATAHRRGSSHVSPLAGL
jgi:hypothetical protein